MINRFRNLPRVAKLGLIAAAGILIMGCCLCSLISSQSNKATPAQMTPAATQSRLQATSTTASAATSTSAPAATSTEIIRSILVPSPTPEKPTTAPTLAPTMTARPTAIPPKPAPTAAPTRVAPTPTVARTVAGYVCPGGERCIKGNINDNQKIYHFPGCPNYAATKIDESQGERWFATAAEAQAAGWRKAQNCP